MVVKVVGVLGKFIGVGGGLGVDVMIGVVGFDIGVVVFWMILIFVLFCFLN